MWVYLLWSLFTVVLFIEALFTNKKWTDEELKAAEKMREEEKIRNRGWCGFFRRALRWFALSLLCAQLFDAKVKTPPPAVAESATMIEAICPILLQRGHALYATVNFNWLVPFGYFMLPFVLVEGIRQLYYCYERVANKRRLRDA